MRDGTTGGLLCEVCGYRVEGLAADAVCPECGVSIVDRVVAAGGAGGLVVAGAVALLAARIGARRRSGLS